ncbi:MAG: hypothetical protein IH591_20830, partial [Bacteroidales bacterium]|nr:hypothetical protein [Bacteroidales bacterium]
EMSGKYISAFIRYGMNPDNSVYVSRDLVWPMLRTIPNDTHASLIRSFSIDPVNLLTINKKPVNAERAVAFSLDGRIIIESSLTETIKLERTLFPSTTLPTYCERYVLTNSSTRSATAEIPEINIKQHTAIKEGVEGSYTLEVMSQNHGTFTIQPGESVTFWLIITGRKSEALPVNINASDELIKRDALLRQSGDNLILETPDAVLNRMFAFAKIRAAESIYQTKGGPMHGPGGLRYYAAIWANDQAEYINPYFPFTGYDYGIESALNSYRQFARFMNDEYKPIPSSIIAEGTDIWNGAGDRGDGAMIAYGAARFALSLGDRKIAEELWPLIEWCLEFNRRKLNENGVVSSDSDELEGRFPAGKANLNTSSLYYDALLSASYLAEELGKGRSTVARYTRQADELRKNIEKYFGAKVQGYDTYRYYDGNDRLRAWICTPLTVGIFDRKEGTIEALFSPDLWTVDGLASVSGDKTFWDRSTLYALRGVFAAGDTERALEFLKRYSNRRLLGDHVPYAVEAYPEGNQRHLSAESGLYCRIYTEGLFGIRPVALNAFTVTPHLPTGWNEMKLRNVHGHGTMFDIEVTREGTGIRTKVKIENNLIINKLSDNGSTIRVVIN